MGHSGETMRAWVLGLILLAGCSVQERKAAPVLEDRDTAAAIARVKAIPGLGARLRPDSALIPATLGVKLDGKVDLDVIVPLTARGPLRIASDEGRVLDVNAEHASDLKGLIESGAMVFVAPSPEHDSVMVAEPARFTDLHVLRGPSAKAVRLQLRLGAALARVRIAGPARNVVEVLAQDGAVWLRSDPLEVVDASGARQAVAPRLEGGERTPVLVVPVEGGGNYPKGLALSWSGPTK